MTIHYLIWICEMLIIVYLFSQSIPTLVDFSGSCAICVSYDCLHRLSNDATFMTQRTQQTEARRLRAWHWRVGLGITGVPTSTAGGACGPGPLRHLPRWDQSIGPASVRCLCFVS